MSSYFIVNNNQNNTSYRIWRPTETPSVRPQSPLADFHYKPPAFLLFAAKKRIPVCASSSTYLSNYPDQTRHI